MSTYYEEILKLWEVAKYFEAVSCFSEWLSKGLMSESETEGFGKNLSAFWGLIEVECEQNPQVTFNLYEMVKKARNWDDETLCEKLRISQIDIEEIRIGHKPMVEGFGLKMLYELFP